MLQRILKLAGVAAMIGVTSVGSSAHAAGERAAAGEFVAAKVAQPPTLDGKISPGEWDRALSTSGIIAAFDARLITTTTEMSVAFDDTHLYFLFKCQRAPGEWRLAKGVRANDDYAFSDPSVEIWIAPPKRVPETYQSIINTYPAVLDQQMIPTRGYTAQGWKGNWKMGVSEDADAYIIEASIPVADFGIDQLRDGDTWRMLLCRTAQGARPRPQGSWSITTGFSEIPQYPPVTFKTDSVVAQLRGTQTLLTGQYDVPVTLVGGAKDERVTVEYRLHKTAAAGDASDIVSKREIDVKAGGTATSEFKGSVPANWLVKYNDGTGAKDFPGGNLSVLVTRADGSVVFRQTLPYVASGWTYARPTRPEKTPPPKELAAYVNYGPNSNVVILRTDILDLPARDRVAGGFVRVLDPNDNDREVFRQPLPKFVESYSDTHFELKGIDVPVHDYRTQDAAYDEIKRIREINRDRAKQLKRQKEQKDAIAKRDPKPNDPVIDLDDPNLKPLPVPEAPPKTEPRQAVVEVSVVDADGKVLATDRQELSLLRSRFTWQDNTLGISDKVLPPWTPIAVKGDAMAVWNRSLHLDGLGLLKSIDNGGTQQIQRMRFVAIKDGKEVPIVASEPKVTHQTDANVTFEGSGMGAGLAISSKNTLEFDGYVVSDVTIAPAAPGAAIDKLYLEVVLPESEATHFCTTAGGWAAIHDETPAYWSSLQTSSGATINDFVPYVWLTNSDRAFLWLADNDRGWITEDTKQVASQEVIRKDGTVTLRINFVEIPAKLDGPTTVRYAYQNFPARPLPAGWRSWVCSSGKIPGAPSAKAVYFYPNFDGTDWVINWPYYGSSFPNSWDRSKAYFDKFADRPEARPTVGSIAHSIGFYRDYQGRSFPEFAVDWGETPGRLSNNDVTQSRGPIDLRVFHYDQWARRSGLRALYADENYIAMDRNFLTGGAYYRADGRLQPGYTYMGLRDFYKRLNYVFADAGVAKPNIWLHMSSGAAYSAWMGDIFMEAENVGPSDEEFDYIEVLPAARMRAIGSAKVNGGAMLMMCQALRHVTPLAEKHIHQFVGWVQAHDALPEQIQWHAPIAQAARFYQDDVEFIGYWQSDTPVRATTPGSVASVHRSKGRALLWIVNTERKDTSVEVSIDFTKLGLDRARVIALNAETGDEIPLTASGLSLSVSKRDFVSVLLVERKTLKGSQSFRADFDQSPIANEALGTEMLEGDLTLVPGDQGQALAIGKGVSFTSHLNLRDDAGRLSFNARFADKSGVVLRTIAAAIRKDDAPATSGIVVEVVRGKGNDTEIVLRRDEKGGAQISLPAPGAGWHEVDVRWKDGRATLAVDGKTTADTLPVPTLNISRGTGPALMRSARFNFGAPDPRQSAITAIDDLTAWRDSD